MTDATMNKEEPNFGIADHHFESAGIPVDDNVDAKTEEKKDEADTQSGVEKVVADEANKASETAKSYSDGSGTNGDAKLDKKEKAPLVNRSEAELDQEQYSELVNGKPVRPEVAGRWMHQRNTARQERDLVNSKYTEATNKVTQLEAQIEVHKTAAQAISQLAPTNVPKAVTLYSHLTSDPVGTLKKLLVEAKANGHNIDGIGEGVDTASIQRMLDQRLAGLEKPKEQANQNQQPATVDNDDDLFVQAFPDAVHHMDIYLDMLKQNPKATNTQLYFSAKNWSDANGYDYTKPLKPQIEARNASTQKQPETKKTETQDNTPRLNGLNQVAPEPLLTPGGKEESYKDIVAKALAANKSN